MIDGARVRLTAVERRHLVATRRWANDPALAEVLDRAWPVSEIEHEAWAASLTRKDRLYFAIEVGDRHIGNVWLWDIDWRHRKAEVRVVIGEPVETGRGFGSEAISLIASHAFERLNLQRVFAFVLSTNIRARAAFERAGFNVEGQLRRDRWVNESFLDTWLLARLR